MTTQQVCFDVEIPEAQAQELPFIHLADMHGFDDTGGTDQKAVIEGAINLAYTHGKYVVIPEGVFSISAPLNIGDGSNASQSSIHNVKIVGAGCRTGNSFTNGLIPNTKIIYDGAPHSHCMINARGGMVGLHLEGLQIDCNNKSAGLQLNNVFKGYLRDVSVVKFNEVAYDLTAHNTYPTGVAYGNGDIRIQDCYSDEPDDYADCFRLDGGNAQTSPDTCRLYVEGGSYFYGGKVGSAGVRAKFADNNYFKTMIIPKFANRDEGGHVVYFEQTPHWEFFPQENVFDIKGHQGIGGVSGTGGNTVYVTLSDGMPVNLLDNVRVLVNDGREYIGQDRIWHTIGSDITNVQTGVASISGATPTTVMSVSVDVRNNEKIEINCTGRGTKGASGSGYGALFVDGAQVAGTQNQFDATGYYKTYASVGVELDNLTIGAHIVEFKIWSDNASDVYFVDGKLNVERKF